MKKIVLLVAALISLCFTTSFAKIKKNGKAIDFKLAEVVTKVEHKLSSYYDGIVVLEWHSPTCSFSSRHASERTMTKLESKYSALGVVWFGIDSSKADYGLIGYSSWKGSHGINYPILRDASGKIGKAYDVSVTPYMVIINKGIVVYQGAIDDDTFGEKPSYQRKNYVEIALKSLTKNGKLPKKFKQFQHAYGCGIKY